MAMPVLSPRKQDDTEARAGHSAGMNDPRTNLAIDPQRLWDQLMETAKIGGTPKGGIKRLTLSAEDREVRWWFAREVKALGCTLSVDEVGNMFAVRPGKRADLAPIAMGSHLDTQPTGGKFDGVLGVLAGLEVLRTLDALGVETNAPLMLVNWTNEEGSRFAPAMLGSAVHCGIFDRAYADSRMDRQGVSFADAITQIGARGDAAIGAAKFSAMFELHIEQGPVLEAEQKDIGVVTGVQGIRWFEINLTGTEAHTGSTPMTLRRDALVGAAQIIESVQAIGLAHGPAGVASIGLIEASPNARNVIAGQVFMAVDLRHPDAAALASMQAALESNVARIASGQGLDHVLTRIWDNPPVAFDAGCIEAVRKAAAKSGFSTRDMVSGAGHDAAYTAGIAPTTMIFVPSAGGLSHNEAESTSFAECGAGAQVLA